MLLKNISRGIIVTVIIAALALAVGGCSSAANNNGSTVNVNMTEYAFQLDKSTVPAGPVTFHVKDTEGSVGHEMVILKTDLDAKQLPTKTDQTVDEDQLDSKGEVEAEPGETKDLSVTLEAGHYVLLCNLPNHYAQGMAANFTVQ